ncbi:hypothetical protein JCM11641_007897 [Rhodosporidiobolus odoratus]
MRTFSTVFSVATLAALARAGGSIDNNAEAARIAAAATQLDGAGNYVFTNVKSGKVLSFTRSSDTTDFFPGADSSPLSVQFSNGAARLSGGNNKCASAQWSYDVEGGVDHAAVSYACAVGSGELTGTATLEKTKQWWYIVPAGTTGDDDEGDNDEGDNDGGDDDSSNSGVHVSIGLNLAAKHKATSSAAAASSPTTSSAPAATTPAASTSSSDLDMSSKQAKYNQLGYWDLSSSSISLKDVDTSGVSSYDRKTWVCMHSGWWLAAHQGYVTEGGHVECESDLAAYLAAHPEAASRSNRLARRSRASHHDMAKKLAKKSQTTYHLIAVDHIKDMATRAIAHESLSTTGGYISTKLNLWDTSDDGQTWTITKA